MRNRKPRAVSQHQIELLEWLRVYHFVQIFGSHARDSFKNINHPLPLRVEVYQALCGPASDSFLPFSLPCD